MNLATNNYVVSRFQGATYDPALLLLAIYRRREVL